jgi:hypothetical protein
MNFSISGHLSVACKAFSSGVILPVAVNTKVHVEAVHLGYPVHCLNIPMASAAVDLPVDMNRVIKKNKIGYILNLNPFDMLIFIEVRCQVLNFWMMNNDPLVA